MDRTKTYIRMSDCPEIQEQRKLGSLCERWIPRTGYPTTGTSWNRDEHIWLPRQDQLQEMYAETLFLPDGSIDKIARLPHVLAERFSGFCMYDDTFTSMEQLWLAFVMKAKYHKVWDGEKWLRQ